MDRARGQDAVMTQVPTPQRSVLRLYAHRWLLVIPFIWQILCAPFVNSADVRVFSLPLPMAWQMAGILIASGVIALVFHLDERVERAIGESEDGPADPALDDAS